MLQTDVVAKWTANAPLAFFDQAVNNLRRYTAIAIDAGDQDHTFEIYPGTHTSNVAFRIQDFVLPFFSRNLQFE